MTLVPAPIVPLGPEDSYASDDDLVAIIGANAGGQTRRALSLLLATRWVAYRIGVPVTDDPPADVEVEPTVQLVAAPYAVRQATLAAAVRFYRSPDVPFGVAGGWDEAVYVRMSMPEVELLLFGQRQRWGIA
jgi:hypothetical protein